MSTESWTGEESPPPRWEVFSRGGEVAVRGEGRTPEEAFEQVALALCTRVTDPSTVEVREEVDVVCDAVDREGLLMDWLRSVVQLMGSRRLRFRCFAVRLDGPRLFGRGYGEHLDPVRHRPSRDVRGVTLSGPTVRRSADGRWTAECEVEV
ncbi:archease [Myxococcus sp. CA051A]|uniref:archease n=1 Tax=unclassified Myxococcus TaxID=2648731 RepID=UPI00157B37BA|nr:MULTISPECIES: archease [unclassified Myxococcus]NTX10909.1 archease [Myxococcus sp. CA056]NTX37205.1 archease [Myxococcus sp. CA033]NTX53094.1 archease [Myxococcus sp. CA039A]NTX60181.1 archease [Myxococcus sp. CA051A]